MHGKTAIGFLVGTLSEPPVSAPLDSMAAPGDRLEVARHRVPRSGIRPLKAVTAGQNPRRGLPDLADATGLPRGLSRRSACVAFLNRRAAR